MKRHLSIAVALVCLVAALAFYVQSDAFSSRIRPFVARPLQQFMGPGSYVGFVRANLFPPYIEVRDIVVPYGGKAAGLTVRKIKCYVNLLPLLWKRVSIPSVLIVEPRISVNRGKNGRTDIVEFVKTVMGRIPAGSGGGSSFSLDLRNVNIENGSLRFVDDGMMTKVAVDRVNVRSRVGLPESLVEVRSVSGRVHAEIPSYPAIDADLNASLSVSPASVRLRSVDLSSRRLRLSAAGSFGLGRGAPIDVDVRLQGTLAALGNTRTLLRRTKEGRETSAEAVLHVRGTVASPIMNGKVEVGPVTAGNLSVRNAGLRFQYGNGALDLSGGGWKLQRNAATVSIDRIEARARYDRGSVIIEKAQIVATDLAVSAEGRIVPGTGYQLSITATSSGKGEAVSLLSGVGLGGRLSVSGILSGDIKNPRFSGDVRGGPVTVRGIAFSGITGSLVYASRSLSIADSSIVQGRSRYVLNGSVDLSGSLPVFHAVLDTERAHIANVVALFYRPLPLDFAASGKLSFSGTTKQFSGSASLDIDGGSAYGESFDGGHLIAELSTQRISIPEILLRKKRGTVRGTGWIGFDGTYSARVDAEGMDLSAVDRKGVVPLSGPFAFSITSSGRFSAPTVAARAESAALAYSGYALGRTICTIGIEQGKMEVAATVEGPRGDRIALNGSMKLESPYVWSSDAKIRVADLEATSLGPVNEYLEKAAVSLDADIALRGAIATAGSLNGSVHASRVSLTLGDYRIQNLGDIRIRMRNGRLNIDSFSLTGQGTLLAVTGSSGLGAGLDLQLKGDANLSLLRFMTRAVEHGDGIASADVRVSGAWKDPNITGELNVRNGVVKIRDVPQNFSAINGVVSFDKNRIITEGLRGEFGGGTITASGSVQLRNLKLVDFTSKAAVENVTVRYPVGFTASVGGVLYYDGDSATQTLSGEVNIHRARYERRVDWKSMLVDFSRGFRPRKKMDIGWIGDTVLNIRFLGKDDILFENNLAKIPLELDMILRGTVNQPQVLGHVEARKGEVYFRKNVFRILSASADFADPNRINPALDVQAETRVREYQIRLSVTGYADRSTVTFVSDPPLTDADILALLTIGRTTEDIRGKEAEVGSGEAVAFATGHFQDILESRARSLTGLDRFQVDPYFSKADVAVPRLTAGKELVKDRLYVTYSSNIGATNPEQTFSIEYLMNKNVSLVGERNDIGDIGADIRFHFSFR